MDVITQLYHKREYLDVHAADVLITISILTTITLATGYSNYQSMLQAIRADWDVYRCNPLVMPFAGLVMPVEGVSGNAINMDNFQYCVKKDTSIALSIAVMPLEFVLYTTIAFMDGLLDGIQTAMNITQWLLELVLAQAREIMNKIKSFIVPIQEIILYIRDSLAKSNAIFTVTLYVVMNMYNIIISGTINIMKILSNFILLFIIVLLAVVVTAFILIPTPATVLGWFTFASAMLLLSGTIIPAIIGYTVMRIFVSTISAVATDKPPPKPVIKKPKKK